MKYFIDSADLEKIQEISDVYPISGVTTNPKILSLCGTGLSDLIPNIRRLAEERDWQLFFQVTAEDADGMAVQAVRLRDYFGERLIVKIPAVKEGYKAVRVCVKREIPTAVTAVHSLLQAAIAAEQGAAYVAPYVSHLDQIGCSGVRIVGEMIDAFNLSGYDCRILGASFRSLDQISSLELKGCHAVTLAPDLFDRLISHPLTDSAMVRFRQAWTGRYGGKEIDAFLPQTERALT